MREPGRDADLRREEEIGRGARELRLARGVRLVVGLHRRFGSI